MADVRVVQLSIGDLVGSTHYMSCAEFGAYMRLLLWHYQRGSDGIPSDDASIARYLHLNGAAWQRIKPVVIEKFCVDPVTQKLTHRRVLCELEKIAQVSAQAKAKALKRWGEDDAPALPGLSTGNANQTPTQTPTQTQGVKTPNPLPVDNVDKSDEGAGSFDKSEGGSYGSFRVMPLLTQAARNLAREKAPGWDLYQLAQVYDDGINSGTRERPRNPSKAFPEWCARYTKGKPPG